ncbi:MAG: RNA polymerase sigma factor [Myxococcaceae bacterium]
MKSPLRPNDSANHRESLQAVADSDEALMQRFVEGEQPAFDALFARYSRPVHAFLARMVGNPALAEDLTQTTFLSVVRGRGRFQSGARFRPWLYAIATNAARDALRRHRPEELTSHGALPSDAAAQEVPLRDPGLEKQVRKALDQLPEAHRTAILMHRFQNLSFAEIAEAMELTESAVKVRAHRGYERLRELLQEHRQR